MTINEATNLDQVRSALTENPRPLIEWAIERLTDLGRKSEWDMEDNFVTTESLVMLAAGYGLPGAGDQTEEELAFWSLGYAELHHLCVDCGGQAMPDVDQCEGCRSENKHPWDIEHEEDCPGCEPWPAITDPISGENFPPYPQEAGS